MSQKLLVSDPEAALPPPVILIAAKNLAPFWATEILRCAQDDIPRPFWNRLLALARILLGLLTLFSGEPVRAAQVTVELRDAADVTLVGAVNRWDAQGNPRRPVDTKARIDAPAVDAVAVREVGGRWAFADLPAGSYDLVILTSGHFRVEGWTYAPVLEFDPFLPPTATASEEARRTILDDIQHAAHYENRVEPLALGGNEQVVRVLMMLVRDKPTSYENDSPGAATIRHELWQYTLRYGTWTKEKRTRVLDRILLPREELRQWTWLWDPALGGLVVKDTPLTISYTLPKRPDSKVPGLRPH